MAKKVRQLDEMLMVLGGESVELKESFFKEVFEAYSRSVIQDSEFDELSVSYKGMKFYTLVEKKQCTKLTKNN